MGMMSFFGYMCFLIIYKWCIDWQTSTLPATPSLITVLIKMILGIGTIEPEVQMFESADTQKTIQEILVFLMAISVPWMLVFKPLLLRSKHRREMAARQLHGVIDVEQPQIQQGSGGYGQLLDEQHADLDDDEREEKYLSDAAAKKKKKNGGGGGHGH